MRLVINRIFFVLGCILSVAGGLVILIFLLMFVANGFFAYIEYVNENEPWVWSVLGYGALALVVGVIIMIAASVVREHLGSFGFSFVSRADSRRGIPFVGRDGRGSESFGSGSYSSDENGWETEESAFTPSLPENFYNEDGKVAGYKLGNRYYDNEGHSLGYDVGDNHYDRDGNPTGYRIGDDEYDRDGHCIGYWTGDTFHELK